MPRDAQWGWYGFTIGALAGAFGTSALGGNAFVAMGAATSAATLGYFVGFMLAKDR